MLWHEALARVTPPSINVRKLTRNVVCGNVKMLLPGFELATYFQGEAVSRVHALESRPVQLILVVLIFRLILSSRISLISLGRVAVLLFFWLSSSVAVK